MGDGGTGAWRREVLDAVMMWTVRLGGVLAVALYMAVVRPAPARLSEPGFLLMYGSFAGLLLLRYRPMLGYRWRALGFCSLMYVLGASAAYSLGARPGPTLACAFVVVAARLFLGPFAMLLGLLVTTVAMSLATPDGPPPSAGASQALGGAWQWLRAAAAFAMPTASIALLVAHVVAKLERSLVVTTDTLSRLGATEAARAHTQATLARTEEALQRSQKLEAVGKLAAGVGHDFNNTLQVVLSWSSILRDERDAATLDEALDAIERAALQARELTQRLLEFGRRDVRAPVVCSPAELLNDSARSLRRLLPEDIDIQLEIDPSPPPIRVDPAQLAHVLLNLGLNARDAMPAGGALELGLSTLTSSALPEGCPAPLAGRYVELRVRDHGVGMTAETQRHLFEPFYTTKGERGTGLGLATAYAIVQRNQGFIRVQSEAGKGATFALYFPAHEGPRETVESAAVEPRRSGEGVVMVAEDDADVRRTMVRVLESAGYHVIESEDAQAAMALLEQRGEEVDLLCTDGVMPGGGTRQLIERYLARRAGGRVIVCSGYVQEELLRRDLDAGTYTYLPKPFASRELVEHIDRMLGRP
jgi:signal transduction histidine kinase/CheY-like chemotaxis protein